MTSTTERTVTNRSICEFLWNALGADPDDVIQVDIDPAEVKITSYAKNAAGGLILDAATGKVVVKETKYKVVHDGN